MLANLLKKQRDAFSLTQFGSEIYSQTDTRSSSTHYRQVIAALQNVIREKPHEGQSRVAETLDEIAEKMHRRSLVVILSDMFDAGTDREKLFSALQHLRFRKHEVIVFQISEGNTENKFEFENRPYRFTDPETNEEVKVYPDDVRAAYLDRIQDFRAALKLKCSQYRIDFVDADINSDLDQILLPFFVKRKNLL